MVNQESNRDSCPEEPSRRRIFLLLERGGLPPLFFHPRNTGHGTRPVPASFATS